LCAIQNLDILHECYTSRAVTSKAIRHFLILIVNNGFFCQAATKVGSLTQTYFKWFISGIFKKISPLWKPNTK